MSVTLEIFERGITIRFKATFKDTEGIATDPADNEAYCTVLNPSAEKKVDSQEADRDSTGVYHYDYTIPLSEALGVWKVEWQASVDSLTALGRKQFKIVHT